MTTHYDVLGVVPGAPIDTIKRAYYRKARAYHPDAHAGSSVSVLDEAVRAMASLNAAWHVLQDATLRDEYDAALRTAAHPPATRRRPSKRDADGHERPLASIGAGFRYWMGSAGQIRRGEHARLNLALAGATDLAPLRSLAPDRLFCLHAAGAQIGDAELLDLQGLSGLQQLDLSRTRVTDAGLLHLQGLANLDTLLLWDTQITDAGLALIGRIESLRFLGLGNTVVTDAGLAGISGLVGLRILQLWGTAVRGPGLRHLYGLVGLEIVSVPRRVRGGHRRRLRQAVPSALVF